jgi:hypothetical protein
MCHLVIEENPIRHLEFRKNRQLFMPFVLRHAIDYNGILLIPSVRMIIMQMYKHVICINFGNWFNLNNFLWFRFCFAGFIFGMNEKKKYTYWRSAIIGLQHNCVYLAERTRLCDNHVRCSWTTALPEANMCWELYLQ